jgi:hypothetical protein
MASEAGRVRSEELELRLTVPPPVPFKVTVQAPEESGAIVPGMQVIPEILSVPVLVPPTSEIVLVFEMPFIVAVIVTVWSAEKAVDVTRNRPLVEPGAIVSEAGKVRFVELELRLTVPPVARVTVTVQAPEEIGAMVAGVQVIPERVSVPVSANSEIVLVLEEPFIVAVTVTP